MEIKNYSPRHIWIILLVIAAVCLCGWFFADILMYAFFALVLAMIGAPMVKLLRKVNIKGHSLPNFLIAFVSLLFILGIIFAFFYFIVPLIVREIRSLMSIDLALINDEALNWLDKVDSYLKEHRLLDDDDDLGSILLNQLKAFFSQFSITTLFGGTIGFVASLAIGIFSVLFITFFCLKDDKILLVLLKKLIPVSYKESFDHIMNQTSKKLMRYFCGVVIEMLIMGILEGMACFILGVPNPFLIGFLGGLLNVIPYVGPLIGAIISTVIALAGTLVVAPDASQLTMVLLEVPLVFLGANLIDNFVLQPIIYSKSVTAHPLEIFFAIMIGASIGGAVGMIFAVPVYSFLKIVFTELFAPYYFPANSSSDSKVVTGPIETEIQPDTVIETEN
ncbi:MAG: AI-2E family transporter [Bacteroidales bacterium]|nr:AI-2E family transporter [Bacteroidales bacterium]